MAVVSISEVNSDASFEVENHAKVNGDSIQESVDNTHVIQHDLIDAAHVLKQKIIKTKLLLRDPR
jgi:hypothetical protein